MARRVFLAFFGGTFQTGRIERVGDPNGTMDSVIRSAYFTAIGALGGDVVHEVQVPYEITRREWLEGLQRAQPEYFAQHGEMLAREGPPDAMIELAGEIHRVFHPISDNTWAQPAADIADAVRLALLYLRPGDVIAELVLLDHGLTGSDGQIVAMAFGAGILTPASFEPTQNVAQQLMRLRPWVDDRTVITLAGCSIGSNTTGIEMLRRVAELLGVRAHGYTEDQLVFYPGIEGGVIECRPSGSCAPVDAATTFAQRIYGVKSGDYGNIVGFE